jgi:exodeoxyribonuclease VII small subunit
MGAESEMGGDSAPPTARELTPDIQAMSFEQAREALEAIVARLEAGEVNLDESIEIYSRGTQLLRHCEAKLKSAQERVEKIVAGPEGSVATEPANLG